MGNSTSLIGIIYEFDYSGSWQLGFAEDADSMEQSQGMQAQLSEKMTFIWMFESPPTH